MDHTTSRGEGGLPLEEREAGWGGLDSHLAITPCTSLVVHHRLFIYSLLNTSCTSLIHLHDHQIYIKWLYNYAFTSGTWLGCTSLNCTSSSPKKIYTSLDCTSYSLKKNHTPLTCTSSSPKTNLQHLAIQHLHQKTTVHHFRMYFIFVKNTHISHDCTKNNLSPGCASSLPKKKKSYITWLYFIFTKKQLYVT